MGLVVAVRVVGCIKRPDCFGVWGLKKMFLILMKPDGKGYHKPREHPLKFGVDPSHGADT